MRGRNYYPDDETRIRIIAGLIELRKAGKFHALDVGQGVRIKATEFSAWKMIGWRRAADMVEEARLARAQPSIQDPEPVRKPPAAESARRAEYLRETGRR